MLGEQFLESDLDIEWRRLFQEANFTTISNSQCEKYDFDLNGQPDATITDNMICVFNPKENACHGDSGGIFDTARAPVWGQEAWCNLQGQYTHIVADLSHLADKDYEMGIC